VKNHKKFWVILLLISIISVGTSCSLPIRRGLSFAEIDMTYAVETVVFKLSQTLPASSTATVEQSTMPQPAAETLVPISIKTPTQRVGNSPTPSQTATRPPCDQVAFVMDVTVPTGASYYPGDVFMKTWRLRNIGTCEWTQGYDLVFTEGDRLSANEVVPLPGVVFPQQEVDITVQMTAPEDLGRYRGGWRLRNAAGEMISLSDGRPIYVTIEVIAEAASRLLYHFGDNACTAEWMSSASGIVPLLCPGAEGDPQGFVLERENPRVEGNQETDRPVLETHPPTQKHPLWSPDENGGWITGQFGPILIQTGSHLLTEVGCLNLADTCDVNFSLRIRIADLPWQELGYWHQEYDKKLDEVDINLADYVGLYAEFLFYVDADGTSGLDQAVWVNPRIEK
jgi:hypothetical protein